jgi:hypothetical protein
VKGLSHRESEEDHVRDPEVQDEAGFALTLARVDGECDRCHDRGCGDRVGHEDFEAKVLVTEVGVGERPLDRMVEG